VREKAAQRRMNQHELLCTRKHGRDMGNAKELRP